jgi:hypothetical protein
MHVSSSRTTPAGAGTDLSNCRGATVTLNVSSPCSLAEAYGPPASEATAGGEVWRGATTHNLHTPERGRSNQWHVSRVVQRGPARYKPSNLFRIQPSPTEPFACNDPWTPPTTRAPKSDNLQERERMGHSFASKSPHFETHWRSTGWKARDAPQRGSFCLYVVQTNPAHLLTPRDGSDGRTSAKNPSG